jgi:hypothetical protein
LKVNDKSFLANYLEDAIKIQKIKKGRDLTEEEIGKLKNILNDKLNQREQRDFIIENNYTKQKMKVDALNLANQLSMGKYIMTGYGVLYKQHDEAQNLPALLLDNLVADRDVAKHKEFSHANDDDQSIRNYWNKIQKVIKVLANSW